MSAYTAKESHQHHVLFEKLQEHRKPILWVCGASIFLGFTAIAFRYILPSRLPDPLASFSTTSILAMAALGISFVIGFLFGIPKVVQSKEAADENNYQLLINTNLTEVSDWLTKIIIGLGIANLASVSDQLTKYSTFFSPNPSDSTHPAYVAFGSGVIIYFSCVGLISGYVVTRLYLAEALSIADRTAISGNL